MCECCINAAAATAIKQAHKRLEELYKKGSCNKCSSGYYVESMVKEHRKELIMLLTLVEAIAE